MYKVLSITVVVLLACSISFAKGPEGTRTICFIQPDRDKSVLEQDAELIWQIVNNAKQDDFVEALTLDGKRVFSLRLEKGNALEQKRDRNIALGKLRQYYLDLINNPKKSGDINVASALKRGVGRFNAEKSYKRYIIVMLSGGIQRDGSVDFSQGYPSDSWLVHKSSPFPMIPRNTTGRNIEVLFVPQLDDFANSLHMQKIERFYGLLLSQRQAALTGFNEDHYTVSELAVNGSKTQPKSYRPSDIAGRLVLYRVDGSKQYFQEEEQEEETIDVLDEEADVNNQEQTSSVIEIPLPGNLTGSVLKFSVDNGTASL